MEVRKNGLIFKSKSGQFTIELDHDIIITSMGNIKTAGVKEYLDYMSELGNLSKEIRSGKVLLDLSNMINYDITTRAAAVKAAPDLFFSKVPYLVLAAIKGNSLFENLSMQTAIAVTKPLSKKFLDGKLFEKQEEAASWLKDFPIPTEYLKH